MKIAIPWVITALLAILLLVSNRPKEIRADKLSDDFARFYSRPNEKIYEIYTREGFSVLKTKLDGVVALSVGGKMFGIIEPDGGSIQLFRKGHLDVWYPGPEAKPDGIQIYSEGMEPRRWRLLLPMNQPPKLEEIPST